MHNKFIELVKLLTCVGIFSLLMSCDWFFIELHIGYHLFTFVLNLNTEDYVLVFLLLFRNNPLLIRIPVVPGVD